MSVSSDALSEPKIHIFILKHDCSGNEFRGAYSI